MFSSANQLVIKYFSRANTSGRNLFNITSNCYFICFS